MDTQKLLEMADSLTIKVGWIRKNTHGTANLQTNEIRLNVETMVAEVFIHEVMHLVHPMLNRVEDESVINELTVRTWERLTTPQIKALAKKILGRWKNVSDGRCFGRENVPERS